MEALAHPPFADSIPIRLNARYVGLAVAVLAAISLVYGLIALLSLFGIGVRLDPAGGQGPIVPIAVLGSLGGIVAALLAIVGGWRMWQTDPAGKRLVVLGLVLNAVTLLLFGFGTYTVNQLVPLLILIVVYLIVVASRFPAVIATPHGVFEGDVHVRK